MLPDTLSPEKDAHADDFAQLQNLLKEEFTSELRSTTLDQLIIHEDGYVEFADKRVPYTQGFLEAAATAIAMPLPYMYRVDFDLFRHNFEQRKTKCTRAVTICLSRGIAVNIADAEYRPALTVDVLVPVDGVETFWTFRGARLSDRGTEVNWIRQGLTAEPEPGDVIELGFRISNSQTGFRGLKASLFSHRLVCSNGAVLTDEFGTARWNYDRRVAYRTSIEKFQKDLRKLQDLHDRHIGLYKGITERKLLDVEFCRTWRRLRTYFGPEVVDVVLGIATPDRQEIQSQVRSRPATALMQPTPWKVYGLHNRMTAQAQRFPFSQRNRLEQLGGELLVRTRAV